MISELALAGDEQILDVGCGDGGLTLRLGECVPRGRVVGIDSSAGMIKATRSHESHNVSFRLLDINQSDFDGQFDVVFSNATLHWVKDHQQLLRVVYRALRAGGVFRANFGGEGNCPTLFAVARALMKQSEFSHAFAGFEWPYYMPSVAAYEQTLWDSPFSQCKVWGEIADHYFPDEQAILAWLAQPSIVPFKQHLNGSLAERFHQQAAARLVEASKQPDGTCFQAFRRINVMATK